MHFIVLEEADLVKNRYFEIKLIIFNYNDLNIYGFNTQKSKKKKKILNWHR